LRADVSAEDVAAGLIGVFTVAKPPEHKARANRLLNILMDGLRTTP
ncbi:SbtR family transcriptional regulator, partial [Mycobacteroides abscessus]